MAETPQVVDNAPQNYRAVDTESQKAISAKKAEFSGSSRSTLWKWANRLGIAGALAGIGIGGASIANQESPITTAENTVSFTAGGAADVATGTADVVKDRVQALDRDIRTGSPEKPISAPQNPQK